MDCDEILKEAGSDNNQLKILAAAVASVNCFINNTA